MSVCTLCPVGLRNASELRSYPPGPWTYSTNVQMAPSRFPASSCAMVSLKTAPLEARMGWTSALSCSLFVISLARSAGSSDPRLPHQAGMVTGQEERDKAAVRMADEVDWRHGERLDQRGDVGGMDTRAVVGLVAGRGVRVMMPEAHRDHAMRRARTALPVPPSTGSQQRAVHEHQRWPLALLDVGQIGAISP